MGQVRTGAASGVATKYMARENAQYCGNHRFRLPGRDAVGCNRPRQKYHDRQGLQPFGREPKSIRSQNVECTLDIDVTAVSSGEEAADSDIIATITNSQQPVLLGEWLKPGTHINAAGNNSWLKREIDTRAIAMSDIIATDDVEQAKFECGELMRAAEVGRFSWDMAVPVHDIVGGKSSGRDDAEQITLFESQGLALEDIAACERIVELARTKWRGHFH